MARRKPHPSRGPRRGPIAWLRRRLLPALARLLTLHAALLVVLWIVGHSFTDRFHATQFLWWIPTFLLLAAAWPMVFSAWALERLASRLAGFRLRPLVTAALLAITLVACFGTWNLHRVFAPAGTGDLRVVYWNLAVDRGAGGAGEAVLAQEPDLAVVANPRWDRSRSVLLGALGSLAGERSGEAAPGFLFRSEIAIATRGRITRYGQASFDMGSAEPEDRGVILFAEVEGIASEPVVLWVVDLPSRPTHWRMAVAERAREAIDAWSGPALVPDELGRWVPGEGAGGFPPADLVVGDFNTPRGSASLAPLTGGLTESHAAAGRGFSNTWPRGFALLGIDLVFAGPGYPVRRHAVVDPGAGRHRMVVVELDAP